jgi:dipeptidyl aminopeptidase/acylaminoacyl peptidase
VPAGPGPFPTILETHGGPSIVQGADFAPMAQAWIDHGFAYITVN